MKTTQFKCLTFVMTGLITSAAFGQDIRTLTTFEAEKGADRLFEKMMPGVIFEEDEADFNSGEDLIYSDDYSREIQPEVNYRRVTKDSGRYDNGNMDITLVSYHFWNSTTKAHDEVLRCARYENSFGFSHASCKINLTGWHDGTIESDHNTIVYKLRGGQGSLAKLLSDLHGRDLKRSSESGVRDMINGTGIFNADMSTWVSYKLTPETDGWLWVCSDLSTAMNGGSQFKGAGDQYRCLIELEYNENPIMSSISPMPVLGPDGQWVKFK